MDEVLLGIELMVGRPWSSLVPDQVLTAIILQHVRKAIPNTWGFSRRGFLRYPRSPVLRGQDLDRGARQPEQQPEVSLVGELEEDRGHEIAADAEEEPG